MKKTNLTLVLAAMLSVALAFAVSCNKEEPEPEPEPTPAPAPDPDVPLPENCFKDIDGNVYEMITLGTQTWMKQNLKVKHYADGTPLADATDDKPVADTMPAYMYPDLRPHNFKNYGLLYNWETATRGQFSYRQPSGVQGICPDGWHLPTSKEWQTLVSYLANHPSLWDTSGSVSKALADNSWRVEGVNLGNEPEHFNQTGFSALPTGFVHDYPLHAGGLWEHWKEHESAIYWCADFNSDYPKPAPVIDTANISPDPYPAWNYGWPDSIYPQPYIFKMSIHSDPSISSLADLHFCAVRCVKN